jgi:hypothetical protein
MDLTGFAPRSEQTRSTEGTYGTYFPWNASVYMMRLEARSICVCDSQ